MQILRFFVRILAAFGENFAIEYRCAIIFSLKIHKSGANAILRNNRKCHSSDLSLMREKIVN